MKTKKLNKKTSLSESLEHMAYGKIFKKIVVIVAVMVFGIFIHVAETANAQVYSEQGAVNNSYEDYGMSKYNQAYDDAKRTGASDEQAAHTAITAVGGVDYGRPSSQTFVNYNTPYNGGSAYGGSSGGSMAGLSSFSGLVDLIIYFIQRLVPLVISLTVLVFLWGIFKLVQGASEKSVEEGAKYVLYGIVGLFVMVSVWGLVGILTKTFFGGSVFIPQLRTSELIEHSDSNRV